MKTTLLNRLAELRAAKRPCAVVTDVASGLQALVDAGDAQGDLALTPEALSDARARIAGDRSGLVENLFIRVYAPPVRMVIVGAVHIAQALAPMAQLAGFDVTVIDPREGFARAGALAGITAIVAWPDEALDAFKPDMRTAVVTLTHDPKLDDPALTQALQSEAFYIGALGSKKTHSKRLERLVAAGFTVTDMARIRGPVGLDIKAVTPAEIAVSILAQVIATLRAE